jgi:single-strand DNA-binding protein
MNNVVFVGRINEPRLKGSEHPRLEFGIADRFYDKRSGGEGAQWINCVMWGPRAEKVAKHLTKGTTVTVRGTFRFTTYTDRDGNERKNHSVTVEDIHFDAPKKRREGPAQVPENATPFNPDSFGPPSDDDDIPF